MNSWVWDLSVHQPSNLRYCDNLCLMLALQNGNQHSFDSAICIGPKRSLVSNVRTLSGNLSTMVTGLRVSGTFHASLHYKKSAGKKSNPKSRQKGHAEKSLRTHAHACPGWKTQTINLANAEWDALKLKAGRHEKPQACATKCLTGIVLISCTVKSQASLTELNCYNN